MSTCLLISMDYIAAALGYSVIGFIFGFILGLFTRNIYSFVVQWTEKQKSANEENVRDDT